MPGCLAAHGLPRRYLPADYTSRPENFTCLVECRRQVCEGLGLAEEAVELSARRKEREARAASG